MNLLDLSFLALFTGLDDGMTFVRREYLHDFEGREAFIDLSTTISTLIKLQTNRTIDSV